MLRKIAVRLLFALAVLVTGVALYYTASLWHGRQAWRTYFKACEATGELAPENFMPAPAADDQNLAKTPLFAELFPYRKDQPHRLDALLLDIPRDLQMGSWQKGEQPQVRAADLEALKSENGATGWREATALLDEVQKAMRDRPRCVYTRDPTAGLNEQPYPARPFHRTAMAFELRALCAVGERRAEAALADVRSILQLGFLCPDAVPGMAALLQQAAFHKASRILWTGLAAGLWNEGQLAELQRLFEDLNFLDTLKRRYIGERAIGAQYLESQIEQGKITPGYYGYPEGCGRPDCDSCSAIPRRQKVTGKAVAWLYPRGWQYQNLLELDRFNARYVLGCIRAEERRLDARILDEGEARMAELQKTKILHALVVNLLSHWNFHIEQAAQAQDFVGYAVAACAVERFRLARERLPVSLGELAPEYLAAVPVRALDGTPLEYRAPAGDGYELFYPPESAARAENKIWSWKKP